MAGKLFSI